MAKSKQQTDGTSGSEQVGELERILRKRAQRKLSWRVNRAIDLFMDEMKLLDAIPMRVPAPYSSGELVSVRRALELLGDQIRESVSPDLEAQVISNFVDEHLDAAQQNGSSQTHGRA